MLKTPDFLKKNDLVLAINPSGKVRAKAFMRGCNWIETHGFHVEVGMHALSEHFKFAGTHKERLQDLQWALDHPKAKAVFCGRGGFGITHILDELDWTAFDAKPKWLIGYSDITALHHAILKRGFCSIHGPVLQNLEMHDEADKQALLAILSGENRSIDIAQPRSNKTSVSGEIIGGNLSMILNQLSTPAEIDFTDKVLFIEEVGEYLYQVDRMLLQLKRSGKMSRLKALIVGEFVGMKESVKTYGKDVAGLMEYHFGQYGYPIIRDFPAGHGERNQPFIHGGAINID